MSFADTLHTHLQAIQQRNLDAFLATLTLDETISVILPNGTLIETRHAFVDFTRHWFADPDWRMTVDPVRTIETSEMGIVLLSVIYDDLDPHGQPYQLRYYLSLVFAKQQGQWRLVQDQNTLIEKQGDLMDAKKIYVEGLARLPVFCHATVAGDFIYVSGTLGTQWNSMALVEGGVGPQTTQTLRHIETILHACGASLAHLVKVNVFLADINTFAEMNQAYLAVIGDDPPARITVGRAELALGAAVEIDAVAYKRQGSPILNIA